MDLSPRFIGWHEFGKWFSNFFSKFFLSIFSHRGTSPRNGSVLVQYAIYQKVFSMAVRSSAIYQLVQVRKIILFEKIHKITRLFQNCEKGRRLSACEVRVGEESVLYDHTG